MTTKQFLDREIANHQVEKLHWYRNSVFFWFAGKNTEMDSDALKMIASLELSDQTFTIDHVGFVGRVDRPGVHYNGMFAVECRVAEYTKRVRYWAFPNVRFVPRDEPVVSSPAVYAN
jgi:hypothetical protein